MSRLKLLLAGISFLGIIILSPALASADVNNFTITSLDSDQTLSRVDKQGELRIVEQISVVFTDNNHGLLRAIPDNYKGHSLQLKVNSIQSETGAPSNFTTYSSNGNTVLKIGDPDRTVSGAQRYTIDYTLRNVITFYDNHDELYWDVNGDQWQQTFNQVRMTLHLPAGVNQSSEPLCFTGVYGSKAQDCTISTAERNITITTNAPLKASENLSYVVQFKQGYFQQSTWQERLAEHHKQIVSFLVPVILFGGGSIFYWWRYGRDAKGKGIIIPQYDAPDGLRPIYVGTIMDFKVDNRDITATLIDLAIRKYIKIIETKKDRLLLPDGKGYSLELLNADFTQLDPMELKLVNAVFGNAVVGKKSELTKSKSALYSVATTLRKQIPKSLIKSGYLRDKSPTHIIGQLIIYVTVATVVCGVVFMLEHSAMAYLGVGVAGLIASICLSALDARTTKGIAAKEHIAGLKLYLNTAEKHRIETLQSPDAPYATQNAEPTKTVELFEKLLPYAIVLQVEKGWAKQFESLYTSPPDWYSGNWSTFNAAYLASSITSGIGSAVNSSFTAPSSSGGSGGGGGGFSGGGGGGGGGGGW